MSCSQGLGGPHLRSSVIECLNWSSWMACSYLSQIGMVLCQTPTARPNQPDDTPTYASIVTDEAVVEQMMRSMQITLQMNGVRIHITRAHGFGNLQSHTFYTA